MQVLKAVIVLQRNPKPLRGAESKRMVYAAAVPRRVNESTGVHIHSDKGRGTHEVQQL